MYFGDLQSNYNCFVLSIFHLTKATASYISFHIQKEGNTNVSER